MYADLLKKFMTAEHDAVDKLIEQTGAQYDKVIDVLLACQGKVVFFGIGKSGHIGENLLQRLQVQALRVCLCMRRRRGTATSE